ncbi:MAG: type VI secretion system accessory protein TagJ [Pyrinomonadaceae bacterium]
MNNAKLQLDAGNLKEAVESAVALVKTNPTNAAARTFLFELSCFSGDWDRAEKQLDVIGHQDVNAMIGSRIYVQNFQAERARMKLFADGLKPDFLMPPPVYVEELLAANNRIREGNIAEARGELDSVEEQRPAFPCSVNGNSYADLRDYNDLTMCVFEVIFKDSYLWLPFEHVVKIEFSDPKTLRDLYWIQAEVELTNGTKGEMFLPALYSGSWRSEDDKVRLGRMTDWRDIGNDVFIGEGTKLFWMDGHDKSILDIRSLEFKREDPAA